MSRWEDKEVNLFAATSCELMTDKIGKRKEGLTNNATQCTGQSSNSHAGNASTKLYSNSFVPLVVSRVLIKPGQSLSVNNPKRNSPVIVSKNHLANTYGASRSTNQTVSTLTVDWESATAAEHGLQPRPITKKNNTNGTFPVNYMRNGTGATNDRASIDRGIIISGAALRDVIDLQSDDEEKVDGATKRRRLDQSGTTKTPRAPTPHASTNTAGTSSSTTSTPAPTSTTTATTTTATTATSFTPLSPPPLLSFTQEYAVWQAKRDKDIAEIKNTLRDKELCALLSQSEVDLLKSRLVQLMLQ